MSQSVISRPKIGFALGSGSARGLSHIGIIRALEEAGIRADCVAGTSVGAIIGAVYASKQLHELEDASLALDWRKIAFFFDVVLPKSGIIDGNKIADFVREYAHSERIEELPLPFRAVATNLDSGEEVVFDSGDVIEAVRASISVPGMFTPLRRNSQVLVDGGLVNPVPVNVARAMGADIVIAVDLNHGIIKANRPTRQIKNQSVKRVLPVFSKIGSPHYRTAMQRIEKGLRYLENNSTLNQVRAWLAEEPLPNIFEVLLSSINIMETQITLTRLQIDPPDLLIQPPLGDISMLEFNRAEEIIAIGYETTRQQLEFLSPELLIKLQGSSR